MRRDYTQECENVGVLLNNLKFSLTMMNEVMGGILEGEAESEQVAIAWMKKNPAMVCTGKTVVGCYYGGANPSRDFPMLINLFRHNIGPGQH